MNSFADTDVSDQSRFERFAGGDKSACQSLYGRYVNELYGYGRGMGFDTDTCMDAIHDVFFKIWSMSPRELGSIRNFKPFLFRSLKNRLLDIHKARRLQFVDKLENLPFLIKVSVENDCADRDEREHLRVMVEQLLSQLTDRQREAIYLRYMQEMEYEDIGTLLDMAPESVRKLVFRGISRLRGLVGDDVMLMLALYGVIFPR